MFSTTYQADFISRKQHEDRQMAMMAKSNTRARDPQVAQILDKQKIEGNELNAGVFGFTRAAAAPMPAQQMPQKQQQQQMPQKQQQQQVPQKQQQPANKSTNELVIGVDADAAPTARQRPKMEVIGCKAKMWKQDPSTADVIGISSVYIPVNVKAGPSDDQIVVVPPKGAKPLAPSSNGDFDVDPKKDMVAFELSHCYCTVRIVINMYERFIRTFKPDYKIKWAWQSPSYIKIVPRAGEEANAYYSRDDKAIQLFYYKAGRETYYTCHSFDIIAHECGHAVLDGMKPMWMMADEPQTLAIHESFADLTVILSLLSQLDICELVIAMTKGDLHNDSFLSGVAEQFGSTMMKKQALRNANNQLRMDQVSNECHDLCQVLTGCVFDILAELLEEYMDPVMFDAAESLLRVSKWVRHLLMFAIFHAPEKNATFRDIYNGFIQYMEKDQWEDSWKEIVSRNFKERKIV